jgi:hypothetical protein
VGWTTLGKGACWMWQCTPPPHYTHKHLQTDQGAFQQSLSWVGNGLCGNTSAHCLLWCRDVTVMCPPPASLLPQMKDIIQWCLDLGVTVVSVYAFSIDNFKRPPDEVQDLMQLAIAKFEELMQVCAGAGRGGGGGGMFCCQERWVGGGGGGGRRTGTNAVGSSKVKEGCECDSSKMVGTL